MLDEGVVLSPHTDGSWGAQLWFPTTVSWTRFDFESGISVDDLAVLALQPTLELVIPLSDTWTLLPYFGPGVALQNGGEELAADNTLLGIVSGGLRATRWQRTGSRAWLGLIGEVRHDSALTREDGLLGDWGSLKVAVELRRDLGQLRPGLRLQGGVYLQALHFWHPVEIEIVGLTPEEVSDQLEVGVSLGTAKPFEVLGLELPRVFLGVRQGDDVTSFLVRFWRL
jgi:hypothetical protein